MRPHHSHASGIVCSRALLLLTLASLPLLYQTYPFFTGCIMFVVAVIILGVVLSVWVAATFKSEKAQWQWCGDPQE